MKLPLAMRPNDAAVLELREQLEKSRTAVAAAQTCLSGTQNDCVAAAIENLRQASPQSPWIKQLEQRTPAEAPQPAATATTDRPSAQPQPSFDCKKATSVAEKLICADAELARMDEDLNSIYQRARQAAPDKSAFQEQARAAWRSRELCNSRDCLVNWYANRKKELTAMAAGSQPAPQAPPGPTAPPPQAASLSVTAHSISMENQARATDPSGRPITQLTIQRSFGLSQPAAAQVQELFVVQTVTGQVLFRGSPNRTPELGNGNFGGRGNIPLPMALEAGQYEMKHQVLSGTTVLSERSLRFFGQGAPAQPPPQSGTQQQADPADALVRRFMAEGERCRIDRDCGCMKDKAVAVSSIEPQNQWAGRMRQLASDCARAKLEIK
jgi:uncharacterized protein